ncbi:MAG: FAD-dependent oxidoreductase, partial [Planctomycetes bacterium]|nr:FAD-dependent oxidoreductase [Planctomycetota bacterium]
MKHYDCVVIGTGPAGQKGAIQAAKLGKRVAIVEKNQVLGGTQINTGTIPSKALREAVLHLTGANRHGLSGQTCQAKKHITIADLASFSQRVIRHEWEVIRNQFDRNGVELLWGKARFTGPHEVVIQGPEGDEHISADYFLLGVGTKPARPENVSFNGQTVFTSDEVMHLNHLPKTMIVVGGGVIGTEYACIMATLGVQVTLVEGQNKVLGFLDQEIADAFQYFMRQNGITLRLGERVEQIHRIDLAERSGDGHLHPLPVVAPDDDTALFAGFVTAEAQRGIVRIELAGEGVAAAHRLHQVAYVEEHDVAVAEAPGRFLAVVAVFLADVENVVGGGELVHDPDGVLVAGVGKLAAVEHADGGDVVAL